MMLQNVGGLCSWKMETFQRHLIQRRESKIEELEKKNLIISIIGKIGERKGSSLSL